MVTLKNISEHGLAYIAMGLTDIISGEFVESSKAGGMYLKNTWLTPETCYWFYKLLKETSSHYSNKETLERLKNGTNAPEVIS